MTYEAVYSIAGAGERSCSGLTLYEARKALLDIARAGGLSDGTHIRRAGRCVGFYSEWHGQVRPMFQALPQERHCLTSWA